MSLIEGDVKKKDQIYRLLRKFGPIISVLSYLAGLVYFCLLPHPSVVHNTYLSENALIPGSVASDIQSSDMLVYYKDLLTSHIKPDKTNSYQQLDINIINDLFSKHIQIESYIQHFNITNPYPKYNQEVKYLAGRNVYAFARGQRADGTESIVVSAPIYVRVRNETTKTTKKEFNLIGISQLFLLAELAKSNI
jgi:hypothetical protein